MLRALPAPLRGHSAALGLRPAALTDPTEQNPHQAQARLGATAQQRVPARCWEPTGSAHRPVCDHSSDRGLMKQQSSEPPPPELQQHPQQPHLLHKALSGACRQPQGDTNAPGTPQKRPAPPSAGSPHRYQNGGGHSHFPAAIHRRAQHTNTHQAQEIPQNTPASSNEATPSPPAMPKEGGRSTACHNPHPASLPPQQDAGALLLSAAGTPCSSPWKPAALRCTAHRPRAASEEEALCSKRNQTTQSRRGAAFTPVNLLLLPANGGTSLLHPQPPFPSGPPSCRQRFFIPPGRTEPGQRSSDTSGQPHGTSHHPPFPSGSEA